MDKFGIILEINGNDKDFTNLIEKLMEVVIKNSPNNNQEVEKIEYVSIKEKDFCFRNNLDERDLKLLRFMAKGDTFSQAWPKIFISPESGRERLRIIRRNLKVKSTIDAINLFIEFSK